MFESIVNLTEASMEIVTVLEIMLAAVVAGMILSFSYIFTQKKGSYTKDFVVALAMLPMIVSIVIVLVGNSVARAFSLAGAFALVRFRSAPGSAKDIAVVFLAMATGLACGLGYVVFAVVFMIIACVLLMVLSLTSFGERQNSEKQLKITIPEDLNYDGVFDELFNKYTDTAVLKNIKTTNMGTLYELTYIVTIKKDVKEKEFIDDLRCRNGNLTINLSMLPDKSGLIL